MKTELKPTLWRTARALANVDRLNLLRLVYLARGSKGVVELAAEADVSVPTASTYLRALNARGLISVIRSGPYVYYGTGSDRSRPAAAEIQKSCARLFAIKVLPKDWSSRLLPLLQAYSHPRREMIVRILGSVQPIRYAELKKLSGFGETPFLRHLGLLSAAGVVIHDGDGAYSLAKPGNSLAAAFLKAALA